MLRLTCYLLAKPFRQLRRILVLFVGSTVLLMGIALLFLPGPAFVVIPAGLGILAIEFAWARTLLKKARGMITGMNHAGRASSAPS
jgi:hypothetical protein